MQWIPWFIPLIVMIILGAGCNGTVGAEVTSTETWPAGLTPSTTVRPTAVPDPAQLAPILSDQISTDGLILAAHVSREDTCYDIGVYDDDHYTVVSCMSDFTYPSPQGSLDSYESSFLRGWAESFQSFEERFDQGLLKFVGTGKTVPEFAAKASMRALLGDIEWRAHGFVHRGGWPSAVLVARSVLSNRLGIPLDRQNVLRFDVMDFPDACLGAPHPDEVCTPAVTQGFHIQFVAQGMLYEYRTDVLGYDIRPFGEPQIAPTPGPAG